MHDLSNLASKSRDAEAEAGATQGTMLATRSELLSEAALARLAQSGAGRAPYADDAIAHAVAAAITQAAATEGDAATAAAAATAASPTPASVPQADLRAARTELAGQVESQMNAVLAGWRKHRSRASKALGDFASVLSQASNGGADHPALAQAMTLALRAATSKGARRKRAAQAAQLVRHVATEAVSQQSASLLLAVASVSSV